MTDFKNAGSKADGVNFTEIRETALGSLGGGEPVSIRTRGYHRALKSGKQWALQRKWMKESIRKLHEDLYIQDHIYKDNPVLQLTGLYGWLPENIVPIEYFGLDRTARTRFDLPPPPSLWSRIKSWFRR